LRYKLAYRVFANWAAKHATMVISVSEASKAEVARAFNISLARISAIPNGVDKPDLGKVHQQKPLYENYIFYLGQAFPRRHLKETILAFEKLASGQDFKELKLVAVGKDKYNPPIIRNLANQVNGRLSRQAVLYKEYVPQGELDNLYFNAGAVVYVSPSEAFGLPPLEALGYGSVPVVASLPASREIFGDNAFFVSEPLTVGSIASAIREALTNEKKRKKIQDSADSILSRYTWQKHTDRFLEVVKDVIGK